jgi:hypothetical protein
MRDSRWYELKDKAIALRRKGWSLRHVEEVLKIPKSTLSGWFKNIVLTEAQKSRLAKRDSARVKAHLVQARKKAAAWHHAQKKIRMMEALRQAQSTLDGLEMGNKGILDLALAILYLGEGLKSGIGTGMGNSNPLILRFFITALQRIYSVKTEKIKCELHLRYDQDPQMMRRYWSRQLKIPLKNFTSVSVDQRTQGSTTYPHYKGVCVVRCSRADVQRKLIALSMLYCEQMVSDYMGG